MLFRILGIIIGIAVGGGIWGAIIGYFVGSGLDSLFAPKVKIHTQRSTRNDFLDSFLILAADVIKADGRFTRSELYYLKDYLVQSLGNEAAGLAMRRLQEIMKQNYNIPSICASLRQSSSIHERLLIIQFLFGLANADGNLDTAEVSEIERISQWMGVSRSDFESIKSMFTSYSYSGGSSRSGSGSNANTYRSHSLDDDYKILEVAPSATDDEVKKAYRTLAKKYHPDRVAHLGDDMRKAAEEKFSRLGQAYDNIKKDRGMK